jgi:uncharacterized membrane protein YphA (DoxX/SURF4 family)
MDISGERSAGPGAIGSKNDVKAVAARVIGISVGLFLGAAGVLKLMDFGKFASYYADGSQPRWVFFGSGVVEIVAGAAMLVPRTRLYAAWALLGMIFLICWKPWTVHEMFFLVSQSAAITLLVVLVWLLGSRRRATDIAFNPDQETAQAGSRG